MRYRAGVTAVMVVVALVAALAAPAQPARGPRLTTDKARYLPGRDVVITLANPTEGRLDFENPWRIRNAKTGALVASFAWEPSRTFVRAGSRKTWVWPQLKGSCATDCYNPDGEYGELVPPGRYRAIVKTTAGRLRATFEIGRYFTIAFDEEVSTATFVIFTRRQRAIDDLQEDVAKPRDERRIVSGIVRRGARYNAPWSYTMGTGSIVLGDVFVEVCDGSPHYVEENKKEWMGQRWCPWSSYVDHEGR